MTNRITIFDPHRSFEFNTNHSRRKNLIGNNRNRLLPHSTSQSSSLIWSRHSNCVSRFFWYHFSAVQMECVHDLEMKEYLEMCKNALSNDTVRKENRKSARSVITDSFDLLNYSLSPGVWYWATINARMMRQSLPSVWLNSCSPWTGMEGFTESNYLYRL